MDESIKRFNAPLLEYFTREQMRDIHSASLDILEDVGTVVHHDEAVELLRKAGAYIKDGKCVFIPASLAEEAIRTAPSRTVIYNRNGDPAMSLEGGNVYYGTGSDCPNLLDSFTGERREFMFRMRSDWWTRCRILTLPCQWVWPRMWRQNCNTSTSIRRCSGTRSSPR